MKKQGFTLAEVLITLAIIGVVAALTAPTLVQNAGTAKIGPSLAKAINTWDVANESFLNDNQSSSLKSLGLVDGAEASYLSLLSNYAKFDILDMNTTNYAPTDYAGKALPSNITTSIETVTNGSCTLPGTKSVKQSGKISPANAISHLALSKDGSLYAIAIDEAFYLQTTKTEVTEYKPNNRFPSNSTGADCSSLLGQVTYGTPEGVTPNVAQHKFAYGTVLIDINGLASPNKLGKDVFAFQLNADGSLSAWGNSGVWNTGDDKCNATTVNTGMTCSASVLENNKKVIY